MEREKPDRASGEEEWDDAAIVAQEASERVCAPAWPIVPERETTYPSAAFRATARLSYSNTCSIVQGMEPIAWSDLTGRGAVATKIRFLRDRQAL